jgi:hypothetical protein
MGCDIHSQMEGLMHGRSPRRPRPSARFLVSSATVGSAAAAVLAVGTAGAAGPQAHAARTMSIKESGSLHLSNHHGVVLKESGYAKGTLSGPIYIQLRVNSTRSVSASVQVYPSGGSLSGSASASYHVAGSYASFSGRLNISSGGGRYSKARGNGLSFSGTIKRSNDAVSVRVSGRLSY